MEDIDFKIALLEQGRQVLNKRIKAIKQEITYLTEDLAEDTKSSAGDKYETSREMANLERQKLAEQLAMNKKLLGFINSLSAKECHEVQAGALVETNTVSFYISVSLGEIRVAGRKILYISPSAPLAQILLGAQVGESIEFNHQQYSIKSIC